MRRDGDRLVAGKIKARLIPFRREEYNGLMRVFETTKTCECGERAVFREGDRVADGKSGRYYVVWCRQCSTSFVMPKEQDPRKNFTGKFLDVKSFP